jgi:hypothetical protein
MKQQSEPVPQPPESSKPKPTVAQTGPSVDANHQPVSENDNSANLFEDHILKEKKDAK